MNRPPAVTIELTSRDSEDPAIIRVVAKPNRYRATRYWVALPAVPGGRERWLLVPTVEEAMRRAAVWLTKETSRRFTKLNNASQGPDYEKQ